MGSKSKQLLWGAIIGIITFSLMGVAYYVGYSNSDSSEKGEVLSAAEEVEINHREVYIKVLADCSGFAGENYTEGDKEVRKYCATYQEESAYDTLSRLSGEDEDFVITFEESDWGAFVTSVNNYHPDVNKEFWSFLINGEMSMVGVSDYEVMESDEIAFVLEEVQM